MEFNSRNIEECLRKCPPYLHIKDRIDEIENISMPFFVTAFNKLLDTGRFPSMRVFTSRYLSDNIKVISSKVKNAKEAGGLMGRLSRVYPSLVREFHLFLMLQENQTLKDHNAKIVRDTELDKSGIDVLITVREKPFGIKIFQGTVNSRRWKKIKEKYRDSHSKDIEVINAIFVWKKGKDVNNYLLYRPEDAEEIAQKVVKSA